MKEAILVFKTDAWHSYSSQNLIGVCTTRKKATSICKKQAKKEGEKLSEDDFYCLDTINQTQGYSGEGEFVVEANNVNVLL